MKRGEAVCGHVESCLFFPPLATGVHGSRTQAGVYMSTPDPPWFLKEGAWGRRKIKLLLPGDKEIIALGQERGIRAGMGLDKAETSKKAVLLFIFIFLSWSS